MAIMEERLQLDVKAWLKSGVKVTINWETSKDREPA